MKKYKYSTLSGIVKKFAGKKVIVIGDLLLESVYMGRCVKDIA